MLAERVVFNSLLLVALELPVFVVILVFFCTDLPTGSCNTAKKNRCLFEPVCCSHCSVPKPIFNCLRGGKPCLTHRPNFYGEFNFGLDLTQYFVLSKETGHDISTNTAN